MSKEHTKKKEYALFQNTGLPLKSGIDGVDENMMGGMNAALNSFAEGLGFDIVGFGTKGNMLSFSKVGPREAPVVVVLKSTELSLPNQKRLSEKIENYRREVEGWKGDVEAPWIDRIYKGVTEIPTAKVDEKYTFKKLEQPGKRVGVLINPKAQTKDLFEGFKEALGSCQQELGQDRKPVQVYARDKQTGSLYRFEFNPETGEITNLEKGLKKVKT